MPDIHPTALVDPAARVAADATIGPYSIIGPDVAIGAGTVVGPHVVVTGRTKVGMRNRIFQFASIGDVPQDRKYGGEPTTTTIGDDNVFREFMTINAGTAQDRGDTKIGHGNLFLAYTHVAHDCVVGSRTVFANGASLAGHCAVEDDVVLGAFAAVRQFCRVGRHAFVGAFAPLNKDVLPFLWTSSERPTRAWKVNSVGLSRKGFSDERVAKLQKAYRALHRHRHDKAALLQALDEIESQDVAALREFIATSKAGVHGA